MYLSFIWFFSNDSVTWSLLSQFICEETAYRTQSQTQMHIAKKKTAGFWTGINPSFCGIYVPGGVSVVSLPLDSSFQM
jgi:hypothetical protein